MPSTKEKLISTTIRIENHLKMFDGGRYNKAPTGRREKQENQKRARERSASPAPSRVPDRLATTPNNTLITPRSLADVTCFKYQKKDYYTTACLRGEVYYNYRKPGY